MDGNSFCKRCGQDVRDFYAPDYAWDVVVWPDGRPPDSMDTVLCYGCFSELCWEAGLHGAWALIQLKDLRPEQRRGFNKFLGEVT